MSLHFGPDAGLAQRLGFHQAEDVLDDPRGVRVRCLPRGSTWRFEADGQGFFRKVRVGHVRDARNEWQTLFALRAAGLAVPEPVALAVLGRRTALVMREVPGRELVRLLIEAGDDHAAVEAFVLQRVAPLVARLHAGGRFHRDLYWGHLLATSLRLDGELHLIDVERVVRPRFGRRRWLVKDLAALLASWPRRAAPRLGARFLRACGLPLDRTLIRAILHKAARIRAHRPRHDGAPPVVRS